MNQSLNLKNLLPDFTSLINSPLNNSKGITALFVLLTFLAFLIGLFYLIYRWQQGVRKINFISNMLKNINSNNLIQKREQLKQDMMKNKECGDLWNEFDESLVQSNYAENKRLYNTIDAAYFFNASNLAKGITENRLIAAMPGILTAIGVLGTFAGLTLGLGGVGSIDNSSTQHLKEVITNMIHAASIAFTTSFWGVLFSVIFNAFEKCVEGKMQKRISKLQNRIDYLFPRLTPEEKLTEIANYSKSGDETIKGLAEQIGNRMQEATIQMKNDIIEGITQAIGKIENTLTSAINEIGRSKKETSNEILSSIKSLLEGFTDGFNKYGEEIGKMMKDSAENLRMTIKELQNFIDKLNIDNKQFNSEKDEKLKEILNNIDILTGTIKETGKVNIKSAEESTNYIKNVLVDLKSFSEELKSTLNSLDQTVGNINGAGNKFSELSNKMVSTKNSLDQVSSKNQQLAERFQKFLSNLESFQDNAKDITDDLRKEAEKTRELFSDLKQFQDNFKDFLSDNIENLNSETEMYFEKLGEKLSKLLENYAKEVQSQTYNRLSEWDKETIRYTEAMQGVVNAMQELIDNMESRKK